MPCAKLSSIITSLSKCPVLIAHVIPQEKFDVSCLHNNAVNELMRCIRLQRSNLITGLPDEEINAMSLGLAHRWVITLV